MHMIPTGRFADELIELPDGPQLLGAKLWDARISPDKVAQQAVAWMQAVVRPIRAVTPAMEAIAWAEGLPFLREILGSENWRALGEFLSQLPADVDEQLLQEQPLVHQLVAGELAWVLAMRMADSPYSGRLEKSGRASISLGLGQILDREGMLPARHYRTFRALLACWTRCRTLAKELPNGGIGAKAEQRYQRFVRNALRCVRPDGRPLLADDNLITSGRGSWGGALFESVLKSGVDEIDRSLAAVALPTLSPGAAAKAPKKTADLPPASIYCEDRAVAVMRRNWNRDDERIAVLFAGQTCEIELVSSGRVAASGAWRLEVSQNGQALEPVSDWESSCWYRDDEVDYLELEIELAGGVKLQRHIVFAREDRFLILADAVLAPQPGSLEYRGVLPLPGRIEFRGAGESREGLLVETGRPSASGKGSGAARPLAQVMPLALPEWRAEKTGGELKSTAEGLEIRQSTPGQRLFAPLFVDLDRSRFRRRMTWRQLTVAEWLVAVPADVAVGFRVAIGDEQWIFYRALASRSNRTLLGHNLATELLIARFGKDGEVASIVEIE